MIADTYLKTQFCFCVPSFDSLFAHIIKYHAPFDAAGEKSFDKCLAMTFERIKRNHANAPKRVLVLWWFAVILPCGQIYPLNYALTE